MMKRTMALGCVLLALAGCDDDKQDQIFKNAQELQLKQPLEPQVFNAGFNESPPILPPADESFCFLTRVSGDFQGGAENIDLDTGAVGPDGKPRWRLVTQAQSKGVAAQVTCVRKNKFVIPQDSIKEMAVSPTAMPSFGCGTTGTKLLSSVAGRAFFISGMRGRWSGGGEVASIVRTSPSQAALGVRTCTGNGTGASALSYVIRPDNAPLRYIGPSGETTQPISATFASALMSPKDKGLGDKWYLLFLPIPQGLDMKGTLTLSEVPLAPVEKAVCGLVSISGKFRGGGEFVEIVAENGNWVMRLKTEQENAFIGGAARCILRDQRNPA